MKWTLLVGIAAMTLSLVARADAYPSKPITFIVPVPPGGATDALARTMAEIMSKSMGQPIIIDNDPERVARSARSGARAAQTATRALCDVGAHPERALHVREAAL